ncbi:Nuclear pore complex protein Nup133 [Merluccius polli]|uniref:Nuclear pore complex protein Nup133 n=1 Tax=Merluccius polli TaxID=89951 RepID=A0AA47NRX4_MERPO|nr:Nuclear pore complex protein Nup133 [Merluccius polli]
MGWFLRHGLVPETLCVCKELQLAPSEYDYTADLVALSSPGPLETASVQSISVLTVAPEGRARSWASLAHEGNYTEAELDLGDLCNFVVAVRGGSFVVSSCGNHLLRVSWDSSGRLASRALQHGQGMLSGIGRRVSSLFGMLAPPTNDTLHSLVWAREAGCLYSLTSSSVCRWEVGETSEQQTLSWDARRSLHQSIADAIWGSESNYEEMKEGVNVSYLDMKLSQSGLVMLAAAWHSLDTPCIAYFCLVTLQDPGVSDHITVEVTKHTAPFQTEEALQTTRLVVPSPGATAFLYTQELVFACSTGTGRGGPPDEKIAFSASGDGVRGGGCCGDLPIFFSQNSGLVAVVARQTVSILPETMEDSLCSSLAAAPEASMMETPTRVEAVAHEDKTKMLKAAFLQFCRHDLMGAQALVDELFPAEGGGEGEEGAELDEVVTRIDLDLVDDYPASDPRWAESVPEESGGFPLTSLIILHQLEDKMKAHVCFMDFLLQVGLLERLGQVTVRGGPMATRLLLCEHAEKLQAAVVLKTQHGKHGELVNAAVTAALRRSGAVVPPSLTPADVFFREVRRKRRPIRTPLDHWERVRQISLVFECVYGVAGFSSLTWPEAG